MWFLFYFILIFSDGSSGATISVINDCGFTVWPGISGSPAINITGFELAEGNKRTLDTPDVWQGQIWGRTGCTFNGSGQLTCKTGDCGTGEMECNGRSATPPVTLVEFKATKLKDYYYDVGLIKGYNLPMTMEATGGSVNSLLGCMKTGCVDDLNKRCPMELMLEVGEGCQSACHVFDKPEYCCKVFPCKPTLYSRLFNSACPRSYSDGFFYTSYWCDSANYTVRFCPPADTFSTIKVGGQLNYYDQLVSVRGNFTLGFFDSDGIYLGIWYTGDAKARKVWVANPNKPIISTSAGLITVSIDPNTGNLIITSGGTTLMNIIDVQAGPNPNVTATLEDTGNFRLINERDKRVLWQSFDHPTNVLLPGMKLGFDKTTGQNWTLTSWLSNELPRSGPFTLSVEPIYEGVQGLVIRRRGQPYWRSKYLFYSRTFEDVFALYHPGRQPYYTLILVYNANTQGRYLSYESSYLEFPMWILTPEGRITDDESSVFWSPEFCYGYESSNGCVVSSLPKCRKVIDSFNEKNGEFDTSTKSTTDSDLRLSISDCFAKCWNDCSCVGFKSHTINGTGCDFWSGSINFLVHRSSGSSSRSKYVINSLNLVSSSIGKKARRNTKRISIWTTIGVSIPLIFFCIWVFWYRKKTKRTREGKQRRKRDAYFLELTASESFNDVHQLESDTRNGKDVLLFSFESIMAATGDFSIENKLGQGGFGPVYKGKLSDGREVAIKRLSRTSGQGLVEFKNELILIAKLQHANLVRVLGCCIHEEEKMLIYEYMPNKSLDFFLFDESKRAELDWPRRLNIIEGIAQGLLYLHKYSRMRVIHRDLKASNILLDENMNPKISDFGMARIFKENETEAITNRVVGTYGYMSPEYAMEGTFSVKSDIFSFGVLIMEIISGRRNSSFDHLGRTYNLISYAWELWQQGNELELRDPTLRSTCVVQQFLRTLHVALLCVQESAIDRPTTSNMISMLLNDMVSLPAPKRPAFFNGRVESSLTTEGSEPKHCSINNMTITILMEGRR
ncbi:G-type lectin S-receptor-like serine/threonine-protein kinase At1g67520 [Bidens hawaiensis]|uniref:G-type lectin S-receptor-like serine/threonine-protein kinase At1g67520 n=1 Tax=Bidens hawaiensis TaxID=980011 RepID=UPI00404B3EBC